MILQIPCSRKKITIAKDIDTYFLNITTDTFSVRYPPGTVTDLTINKREGLDSHRLINQKA